MAFKHRFSEAQIQGWREKIESWLSSGLNQQDWCRFHGESSDKLYYWRKHLSLGFNKTIKEVLLETFHKDFPIYLFTQPTNLHKGFESLSRLVAESQFDDLVCGARFAFINRRRNSAKVLYFDGESLVIWNKRLERGTFPCDERENELIGKTTFLRLDD